MLNKRDLFKIEMTKRLNFLEELIEKRRFDKKHYHFWKDNLVCDVVGSCEKCPLVSCTTKTDKDINQVFDDLLWEAKSTNRAAHISGLQRYVIKDHYYMLIKRLTEKGFKYY